MRRSVCFLLAAWLVGAAGHAEELTRAEVMAIARSFAEYTWFARPENVRRGADAAGVQILTPSAEGPADRRPGYWLAGQANTGVPYKWGGFDSLASFATGVKAGKAAGDLYHPGKRAKADAAVSAEAVGVDCSGFISRCWKLPKKYGTSTLPSLCLALPPAELKAGDIMNYDGGHVILFHRWLDEGKTRAEFYEAEPYSKVLASEKSVPELTADGFRAWHYRRLRD